MKRHRIAAVLLILSCIAAGTLPANAAEPQPTAPCRRFVELLQANEFTEATAVLGGLLQQAHAAQPEIFNPDTGNRDALLGLDDSVLSRFESISRSSLEAFFAAGPAPIPDFTPLELQYIGDTLVLKQLSDSICAGAASKLEKVQRLTGWAFEHIAGCSGRQLPWAKSRAAYPFEIAERGFGLDYQIAWVLAALARQQDMAATIVFLQGEQAAGAHAALAYFLLKSGSVFADPARGVVSLDGGGRQPIGIRQAVEQPKRIAALHAQYRTGLQHAFANAAFCIPYHPFALLPKMKIAQAVLTGGCSLKPQLYIDLVRAHKNFGHLFSRDEGLPEYSFMPRLMTVSLPGRAYRCSLWLQPLAQMASAGLVPRTNAPALAEARADSGALPAYHEARRAHLRGQYAEAEAAYRYGLIDPQQRQLRDDVTYFLGLLHYDRKNYQQAALVWQRYLDRGYGTWKSHARFLLARTAGLRGDTKKSAQLMQKLRSNPVYGHYLAPHGSAGAGKPAMR